MRRTTDLVTNRAAGFETITTNIAPQLVRNDTMEGRDFLVAPMVMLVEGVVPGSQGPLYYPGDELADTPEVWNHKPVVVYHPTMNGQGVSACDPDILTQHKVGVIMNARYADGRLTAEAWLEESRIEAVDPRIGEAIQNNRMMELSTGLFVDNQEAEGEFGGKKYSAIARNYRPDHLALLPDKIGACSIADGAGFLRNELAMNVELDEKVRAIVSRKAVELALPYVRINELSHDMVRMELRTALLSRFGEKTELWIEDVYETYLIYELGLKLYRIGYGMVDGKPQLSDADPVEVVRKQIYEVKGSSEAPAANNKITNNNDMSKKEIVDKLIANKGWAEEDREHLSGKDEEFLAGLLGNDEAPVDPVNNEKPDAAPEAKPATPVSADEYIANAPEGIREVLSEGMQAQKAERARLVGVITGNERNPFSKEDLAKRSLADLRGIAAFAAPVKNDSENARYDGNGDVVANTGDEEPLGLPVLNFGE